MSNPTTLVETFNNSLGSLTGVDPIRYNSGLWLEEGTTNAACVPRGGTPSLYTALRATLTSDIGTTHDGAASLKSERTSGPGSSGWQVKGGSGVTVAVTAAEVWTLSAWARSAESVSLRLGADIKNVADGGGSVVSSPTLTLEPVTTDWERLVLSATIPATSVSMQPFLYDQSASANGATFHSTNIQFEKKPYATSPADGYMGAGYAWVGTVGQSASTRAASSASRSPTGILSPSSGALSFRITPTIETGVEEIWGEVGAKGSGTDHVRWGRDSSKHPFAEWSSNDAAYQRLTGSETLNALTAYDLYLGHSATTISLAVDAGTLQTGTRDAVSASWGAGNLALEATAGGVVYNQFAAFNRTLNASEIKTLDRRNSWSRTMFGNPFAYFQLRPY